MIHFNTSPCPFCGAQNEAQFSAQDNQRPPSSGDVFICWHCSQPAISVAVLSPLGVPAIILREPTEPEAAKIAASPHVQLAISLIQASPDVFTAASQASKLWRERN